MVMLTARIITSYDRGDTANASGHDRIIERAEGSSIRTTEHIVDIFVGETWHQICTMVRDLHFAAIFVIINRVAQNIFGNGQSFMLIKFDMRGTLDFDFLRGRDDIRVEIISQTNQCLHNALYVNNHRFDRASQNCQLLLQEIPGGGDALPHQDFVSSTTNARKLNTLSTSFFSISNDLWSLRRCHDHFAESRLMSMNNYIDIIFF